MLPVSALTANTQPRVLPRYMQPSAITGVPVKSPAPPFATEENTHADCSVGTSAAEMTFSSDWSRVFDRSRPYEGQSPPVNEALAHVPAGSAACADAGASSATTARAMTARNLTETRASR